MCKYISLYEEVKSIIDTTHNLRRRKVSVFSYAACFDLEV